MAAEASSDDVMGRSEIWRAFVVATVLVALVVWPVLRRPLRDSFPHSTYPMFSENREPQADIELAVGRDADGADVTLSPELIAGTAEVIVAGSLVRRSVRRGGDSLTSLCASIVERVARDGRDEIVEIVIRTDRLDAVAWFTGNRDPVGRTVHTSCAVPR